jgi:hypothetical protein
LQEFRKNLNHQRINPKQTPRNPSKFRGKKEEKRKNKARRRRRRRR